jgi:hypothetical protein
MRRLSARPMGQVAASRRAGTRRGPAWAATVVACAIGVLPSAAGAIAVRPSVADVWVRAEAWPAADSPARADASIAPGAPVAPVAPVDERDGPRLPVIVAQAPSASPSPASEAADAPRTGSPPGATGSTSAVPSFPYEDQLIGGPVSDAQSSVSEDEGPQPDGYRSTLLEVRSFARSSNLGGSFSESGFFGQHRRETVNWGDWLFEGAWRHTGRNEDPTVAAAGSSNRFTIRQIGMPLAGGASLSNVAGMFRTASGDALNSNFRFNLPGTLLTGVGSYWSRPGVTLQAEHGTLTQVEGFQGLGTRRLEGTATGAGASVRLGERWSAGLQALGVHSRLEVGDYTAATAALAYATPDPGLRWRAQVMTNNQRKSGQWFEGEQIQGFHSTRWGVWNFNPSLYWYTMLLSTGQRGIALRHDYADPGRFWGAGLERTRNDAFDASRAATDVTLLSGNVGYRLDRTRSIGMIGQLRQVNPQFDDGSTQKQRYASATVYGTRSAANVTDRVQLAMVDSSGSLRTRIAEFSWTRDILRGDDGTLGFTAGIARETHESGSRVRPTAGVSYTRALSDRGIFSAWLRYARDADQFSTNYSVSGTVQVNWAFTRHWSVSVSGSLNRLAFDASQQPVFSATPSRVNERSLWLTLRWSQEGGVPYLAGQAGEARGAGIVRGVVYLDEDRDGRRQPSERPAAGVTVWLDGILSVTTGPDGRYEFPLVRAGRHVVRVESSTVRLPWGVADERGRPVEVEARGLATQDLPLIKIGE